jgi:FAD/FMN-containing dehydrogenase
MCSADGVLIVDLSEIHKITFSTDLETVWIGAGAKLADVYEQMWAKNRILPGGGCGDVRVGGLVQAGGWGPYCRALGLTCDRLFGFRMVMASGEKIEVTDAKSDPHSDLFWAVRGGGGGNFGVITEFRFKLAAVSFPIWH